MSLRSTYHCAAVIGLPVLRIVRRGDRHTFHDLTADVQLDIDPDGPPLVLDSGAIARAVHALAAHHAAGEPETFATAIAQHCLTRFTARRATVELRAHRWQRLDLGGRPRDRDLGSPANEVRVAQVITDVLDTRISAGLRNLQLTTSAPSQEPLLLLRLDALWTYGWPEIPFDTQWQQVRRAITEAYAERDHRPGPTLASALARAVLDESPAVRAVEVRLEVARRLAVDMTAFGIDNAGEVFGDYESAREVFTLAVQREEIAE